MVSSFLKSASSGKSETLLACTCPSLFYVFPQWQYPLAPRLPAFTLELRQSIPFLPHPVPTFIRKGGGVRTALASHNTRALHNSWGRERGRDPPEEATGPRPMMRASGNLGDCGQTPDLQPASGQGEAAHVASCSLKK